MNGSVTCDGGHKSLAGRRPESNRGRDSGHAEKANPPKGGDAKLPVYGITYDSGVAHMAHQNTYHSTRACALPVASCALPGLITVSPPVREYRAEQRAGGNRVRRRALSLALPAIAAMALMTSPAAHGQSGGEGAHHASLTEATLALNQDLAREYARGLQLINTGYFPENTRRWEGSASLRPRNQATVYPMGDDGVMLEMTFRY